MKENGSYNADGKHGRPSYKWFVVSLIAAFVLAAMPLSSVVAAPVGPGGTGSDNGSWTSKVRNLQAEISVIKNLQTKPGQSAVCGQDAQLRDKLVTVMRAAEGLMATGGAVVPVTGNSANGTSNNGNNGSLSGVSKYYQMHPEKLLASYIHEMRQIRMKMGSNDSQNGVSKNNQTSCLSGATVAGTSTGTVTGTGTGTTNTPAPTASPSPVPSSTPSPTPTP